MNEDAFEYKVALLLRYGVLLVAGVLLLAWVLNDFSFGEGFEQFQQYQDKPLPQVLSLYWTEQKWGGLLSYLGLAFLICLPALRVLFSFVMFFRRGERAMMVLSLIVIFGLSLSVFLGALE